MILHVLPILKKSLSEPLRWWIGVFEYPSPSLFFR
jgi:hypothetical protein